jgi:hypothetical protein
VAQEQLSRIREGLGEVAYALVSAVVIEEATWCEVAKRFGGIDVRTARAWAVAAIAALTGL